MNAAHEPDELLTIGEMSRRTGVAVSALHYYEGLELIRSRRTAGNRREYRRDTLRILAFIRASQRVGISLERDRKSTRLNSSHVAISYAVFCLKKKKKETINQHASTPKDSQVT